MVRYTEGFFVLAKNQISLFIEDFMMADREELSFSEGKKKLEVELAGFP
jgi:hypothetical protein